FCCDDAFFTIKETELGITADLGTLQRLQSVMPSGLAREIAFCSRPMRASEAVSCGFVNRACECT
ncbi:MAG: enoyl-CoA hydratase-related protein, partial [Porticoccaceae bacterium]|nr:enoyl-CoA hydratase-related protein [Porticoccaceae bacterium]